MHRYFLEVAYKGTKYSGFQTQKNANTIQAEIEKAFAVIYKQKIELTGSSRTDSGVHALQNYFHFDSKSPVKQESLYNINAILPNDIVIHSLKEVNANAHCRFDAISREYYYHIYSSKDPFQTESAFYFPYKLNIEEMQKAASILKEYTDFTSFSKRNTQVKTFNCQIAESKWVIADNKLVYQVKSNRFLRGMVRALTATMLKVGRGKIELPEFRNIIEAKDCTQASFAVPPQGLFLIKVQYNQDIFK